MTPDRSSSKASAIAGKALLSSSSHQAEAKRFLTFLASADAAAIFVRHKFVPLARR